MLSIRQLVRQLFSRNFWEELAIALQILELDYANLILPSCHEKSLCRSRVVFLAMKDKLYDLQYIILYMICTFTKYLHTHIRASIKYHNAINNACMHILLTNTE